MKPRSTHSGEVLYRQVAQRIREDFLQPAQSGDRLPGELKLAKLYGVSLATVREALSWLDRAGEVRRSHRSGNYATDGGRNRKHGCIGVWFDMDIAHPRLPHSALIHLQQIRRLIREKGWECRVFLGDRSIGDLSLHLPQEELIEALESHSIDGLLMMNGYVQANWLQVVRKTGIPVAGFSQYLDNRVYCDRMQTIHRAVDCLIQQGRSRIAFFGWYGQFGLQELSPHSRVDKPGEMMAQALLQAGLPVYSEWLSHDMFPSSQGAGWEALREVWSARREKPDGIYVHDDSMFMDLARAVQETGVRVPEDVTIIVSTEKDACLPVPFPYYRLETDNGSRNRTLVLLMEALIRGEELKERQIRLDPVLRVRRVEPESGMPQTAQGRPVGQAHLSFGEK